MQRIMNNPDDIVDEMLKGFLKAHSDIVEGTENPRVVKPKIFRKERSELLQAEDQDTNRHLSVMSVKICAMQPQLEKSVLPRQQPLFWMASKLQIREKVLPVCTETIPETT